MRIGAGIFRHTGFRHWSLLLAWAWVLGAGTASARQAEGHWETRAWGTSISPRTIAVGRDDSPWILDSFTSAARADGINLLHWDGRSWSRPFAVGGRTTGTYRLAAFGDDLFLGGSFNSVQGVAATNVALWSGTEWVPMAEGFRGANERVNAFAIWRGRLVAGGSFADSGTNRVSSLAAWNGSRWEPMASGVSGEFIDLLAHEDSLYAVVGSPAFGIFRLSDAGWERLASLPSGLLQGGRNLLAWHDGQLHALSPISNGSGPALGPVVRWEDGRWTSVVQPGEITGTMVGLFRFQGRLYLGGRLNWTRNGVTQSAAVAHLSAEGPSVSLGAEADLATAFGIGEGRAYVASTALDGALPGGAHRNTIWQFDGETWSPLNGGPARAFVANRVVPTPQGPVLGSEANTLAPQLNQAFLWDGIRLVQTTTPTNGRAGTAVPYFSGRWVFQLEDGVYATARLGTQPDAEVALRLSGRAWTPATLPIGFKATRLAGAGAGSRLWAGGLVGTELRISRWDGTAWNVEPGAEDFSVTNLTDLVEFRGRPLASGLFTERGSGRTVFALVREDGRWRPWDVFNGLPERLVVAQGQLLAAGRFTEAGGVPTSGLVSWDGQSWSDLSDGLQATRFTAVALGSDGVLAAGGSFVHAGSTNIAVRRNGRWEGLASGLGPEEAFPSDLAWDGQDLLVAGNFVWVQQEGVQTESRGFAIWRGGEARLEPSENADGERGFRFAGDLGGTPVLSASTNLVEWTPLRNVRASDPRRWIPLTNGVTEPARFLRLR